jgi:3-oxoacyl-[acyl-carrier protein] reductase
LIGLTKTLSKEVAASGINVNALALGYFNTGMINDVPEEMKETITENIPMKKLGDPATVCKTIEYLISKEAKYVTGQTINLNGGMYS